MEGRRLGLKQVRALQPGATAWDAAVPGFCARRQKSAAISYCLKFRTGDGRQRWHTIGRHGAPWTPDTARDEARCLLGLVATGEDPASGKQARREASTLGELCDLYLADAEAGRLLTERGGTKKASTIVTDRSRVEAHIRPPLGTMKVPAVTRDDVEHFMHAVADSDHGARKATGSTVAGRAGNVMSDDTTYRRR